MQTGTSMPTERAKAGASHLLNEIQNGKIMMQD